MDISCVAIVILNYHSWQDTLLEAKTVHDLFSLKWEQFIIIDNASPNESSEMLQKKEIGDYHFLKADKNDGYASGNNIGLRYARMLGFQYVWILNNDIVIENSNLLSDMLCIMETDDSLATVNPDIYSPNGKMFNRDSKRYSLYDLTVGMMAYKEKGRRLKDLGGYGYVYRPQGCCMLLDLDKLQQVDYMDERTFLYWEEMILAERLLSFNYRCACAFNLRVIHDHSKTVKTILGKWRIMKTQNDSFCYYLRKYRKFNVLAKALCVMFQSIKILFRY